MFTGIVTAVGQVEGVEPGEGGATLRIRAPYPDLTLGESISVDGAVTIGSLASILNFQAIGAVTQVAPIVNVATLVPLRPTTRLSLSYVSTAPSASRPPVIRFPAAS